MRGTAFAVLAALAVSPPAWSAPQVPSTPERMVQGQTLISQSLPPARLRFAPEFHYLAGQRFLLGSGTDAEQHFFVDADRNGLVRRLYWVQFEHKLPGNDGIYDYPPSRTTAIGGMSFVYDTKVYVDYAGLKAAPGSDVEKARAFLAAKGLQLPHAVSRVRMFHLPEPDKRSELMIIYVEALAPGRLPPDAGDDMPADDKYPALARTILTHAQAALTISR